MQTEYLNRTYLKKGIVIILALLLTVVYCVMPSWAFAEAKTPNANCTSAILIDKDSGKVLYEKNADAKTQPASITKMMTALLVVENLDMNKVVTVPPEAVGILGNTMKLKVGEKLTVDQLLHALMIVSANDAAMALGMECVGGKNIREFYKMMNNRAKELGMDTTHYKSPNGLIEDRNHYMSARDTAVLAQELMKHKKIREIVKKAHYKLPKTNYSKARKMENTNLMLFDDKSEIYIGKSLRHPKYEGTIGIKTGTMNASGFCLCVAAKRDGRTLIAVVMHANGRNGSMNRYSVAIPMLDYGFENFRTVQLMKPGKSAGRVKVQYGRQTFVPTDVPTGVYTTLPKEADESIASYDVKMDKHVKAPLKKGDKVGTIEVKESGEVTGHFDVVVAKDVKKGGPWSALYISDLAFIIICAVIIAIVILLLIRRHGKRRKQKEHEEQMRRLREAEADAIATRRADKRKRGWRF